MSVAQTSLHANAKGGESSSSYFGGEASGDDLDTVLDEKPKKKSTAPAKKKPAKKSKAPDLSLDDADDEVSLDDAEPAPKPKKTTKRVPAPANLRFNKDRVNKNADLELEPEEPAETEATEVAVTPDVQFRITQAEDFEKSKRWADIVSTLKPVTESLNRTGLLLLAQGFSGIQNANEEVRILDLVKNKYPRDYVALTKLGVAYAKVKKNTEAAQAFYDAKEINPRYQPAYDALLNQLQTQGNSYEARSLVEDMLERFGKVPRYYTILCRLLTKDAFLDKAVETCEAATHRDPNVPENYVNLAVSLKDKLEPGKALTTINEAAGKFPVSEPVLVTQGQLYLDRKDYPNAAEAYRKATTVGLKSLTAWVGYGRSLFELHRYKDALDAFKHACKIDPHSSKDFREMAGRLHKDKNKDWEYKYVDSLSACGAGA